MGLESVGRGQCGTGSSELSILHIFEVMYEQINIKAL